MNTNDKDLDNQELKVLRAKLPSILTTTEDDAIALLRGSPDQAASIAEALAVLGVERTERQWLGHSMASLPLESWTSQDGLFSVAPLRDASLRYLNQEIDEGAVDDIEQLRSRKRLYDELSKHTHDMPARFQPMLTWKRLYENYAINSDIALVGTIDIVELLFMEVYSRAEARCRDVNLMTHALDVPTPIMFIPRLAKQSLSDTRETLLELAAGPDEMLTKAHLVAHLMCNVAANRWLLESARLGALAQDAAAVTVQLLQALNSKDIFEVPEVETDVDIKNFLSRMFGRGGEMSDVDGMSRFLSGDDLETTLKTAKVVQQQYVGTRGAPGVHQHPLAFQTPQDTLMFALALVGVFETRAKVDKEFFGKDRSYAAFPGRGTPERGGLLRPHALELAKTMYSQMAFANKGWELLATQVHEYEQAMAVKRSCLQTLIFSVFKRWPAGKLCALHQTITSSAEATRALASAGTPRPESA